jgi:hypothetical protein
MRDSVPLERLADIPDPFAKGALGPPHGGTPRPDHSPSRSGLRARRAVAAGCAIAYELALLAWLGMSPDLGTQSALVVVSGLLAPLVAAALALGAAVRRGPNGLGEPVARLASLVVAPALLFDFAAIVSAPYPNDGSGFWRGALGCMLKTALLAAGPLALGVVAFRRAFASASALRASAFGVACGAISAATLSLSCPHRAALHVIVGHGTMLIAAGLLGALLGRRVMRA